MIRRTSFAELIQRLLFQIDVYIFKVDSSRNDQKKMKDFKRFLSFDFEIFSRNSRLIDQIL